MSSAPNSYYFRRRTIGRAASPPTWACYEQIPYDGEEDSDTGSDSCSEDEDEYPRIAAGRESTSDSEEVNHPVTGESHADDMHDIDMDMDEEGIDAHVQKKVDSQRDVKGKQRAVDPDPESKKQRRRKERPPVYTLRPILTIQKSQGFVWNQVCVHLSRFRLLLTPVRLQDLFVPPYIKDRCSFSSFHLISKVAHVTDRFATLSPSIYLPFYSNHRRCLDLTPELERVHFYIHIFR
jgi:hypothetical protein